VLDGEWDAEFDAEKGVQLGPVQVDVLLVTVGQRVQVPHEFVLLPLKLEEVIVHE
jgi:hypothetical protein